MPRGSHSLATRALVPTRRSGSAAGAGVRLATACTKAAAGSGDGPGIQRSHTGGGSSIESRGDAASGSTVEDGQPQRHARVPAQRKLVRSGDGSGAERASRSRCRRVRVPSTTAAGRMRSVAGASARGLYKAATVRVPSGIQTVAGCRRGRAKSTAAARRGSAAHGVCGPRRPVRKRRRVRVPERTSRGRRLPVRAVTDIHQRRRGGESAVYALVRLPRRLVRKRRLVRVPERAASAQIAADTRQAGIREPGRWPPDFRCRYRW